ncbi:hypothetical protein SZ64_12000 [Erythrobacter sp. SG61-1L]|uniref:PilZ domain-containing protein n=1 Tax=Erythrobacteraceae TaxID=335929 RepID=UPI0006C93B68|nr:PilZ domain-containing protein [Erythrobacter sp. SG61-1L]KPL68752.1 hypothetical protein SZ64_12000 [Erythrobacter sp. SG61-1L]
MASVSIDAPNEARQLIAQCRTRGGGVLELPVLDISPIGCMIDRRAWSIRTDDRVLIKLEGLSYQPATVVWVEDDRAGLMFEQLLYEPILARLRQSLLPRRNG